MEEDWGEIFIGLEQIGLEQQMEEELEDIGDDTEEYVELSLKIDNDIAIAGLSSRVPSRIIRHGWLHQARDTAIDNIVRAGGHLGFRKVTVYTAVIYVDRFFSVMPIKREKFCVAKLLSTACLYLAADKCEPEIQPDISEYEDFTNLNTRSILDMMYCVVEEFGRTITCVSPITFTRYFLSKFCRDDSRIEYARIKTLEIIMSTLGDAKLMSLRTFILTAAATLLASNRNRLTKRQIELEINLLNPNWIIPLDDVCSCYNRLLETNMHKLDIN